MVNTFFPEILADLYRPNGIENRISYNKRMWAFVAQHKNRENLTQDKHRYIDALHSMPEGNILIPCRGFLGEVEAPFDIIAVSFEYTSNEGITKNVALVENYSSQSPVQEGAGKTGLALLLVGIGIPYEGIPHPQSRDDSNDAYQAIAELDKKPITPLPYKRRNARLIASDLTYIGISEDGKLCIAPAVGEPFIAQWDTARHMARAHDAYYKDKAGKTISWLRAYLLKLAEKYYVPFGSDGAFIYPFSYRGLDEIYIIQQRPQLGVTAVPETEAKKVLEELLFGNPLLHPAYPASAFWALDEDEHERRVQHILSNLKTIPRIWALNLLPNDTKTHLKDIVEVLKETLEGHD